MPNLRGLAAALGALGDAATPPLEGLVKGTLLAPHYAGQLQQNAQRAQLFPLEQQLLQGQIARLNAPELVQTPYGAYNRDPRSGAITGEVALPRITSRALPGGFLELNIPGQAPQYSRQVTPERWNEFQTAADALKPNDYVGWYALANRYPEFGHPLLDMLKQYQMNDWKEREIKAHEKTANAAMIRANRTPTSAQPHWSETVSRGKPLSTTELGKVQSTVDDVVNELSKTYPGFTKDAPPGFKERLIAEGVTARTRTPQSPGTVPVVRWNPAAPGIGGQGKGRFEVVTGRTEDQPLRRESGVGVPPWARPSDDED